MKPVKFAKSLTAFALAAFFVNGAVPALAEDNAFGKRIDLAYAAEDSRNLEQRFEQFELHGTYEDAHALNDAWLGMPVRDATGDVVGYVEDAFLDQEGYLTELLVSVNGSGVRIHIDQKHVEYTEVAVLVDLPVQVLAKLEEAKSPLVE